MIILDSCISWLEMKPDAINWPDLTFLACRILAMASILKQRKNKLKFTNLISAQDLKPCNVFAGQRYKWIKQLAPLSC